MPQSWHYHMLNTFQNTISTTFVQAISLKSGSYESKVIRNSALHVANTCNKSHRLVVSSSTLVHVIASLEEENQRLVDLELNVQI